MNERLPYPECVSLMPKGYRHGDGPIGKRDRLLAHRRIDRIEGVVMRGEDLVQGFPEILQQMKAIGDLGGLGRALTSALSIGARPIPCDHLHPFRVCANLTFGPGTGQEDICPNDGSRRRIGLKTH